MDDRSIRKSQERQDGKPVKFGIRKVRRSGDRRQILRRIADWTIVTGALLFALLMTLAMWMPESGWTVVLVVVAPVICVIGILLTRLENVFKLMDFLKQWSARRHSQGPRDPRNKDEM